MDFAKLTQMSRQAVTDAQIRQIEDLANAEILSNDPVRHYETTKAEATKLGAIAFFGDKYGEVVRVLDVPARVLLAATALTLTSAAAGAFGSVRRAVGVPPAEAMRPEAPARFRRSLFVRTSRPVTLPSAVIAVGPFGDVLAGPARDGEEILVAELDLDETVDIFR